MRRFSLWQGAKSLAICALSLFGIATFQGCGEADSPADASPYSELDRRFPEGRPGATDVATRMQDAEYTGKIRVASEEISRLKQEASAARAAADAHRAALVKLLAERMQEEPSEEIVAAMLAKPENARYRELAAAAEAAEAAVEAKYQENRELIRARMWAEAKAYDAMKAEADARAEAAGREIRQAPKAEPIGQASGAGTPPAAGESPGEPAGQK